MKTNGEKTVTTATFNPEVTASQKARVTADWSRIAGEQVEIWTTGGVSDDIYAYGSEIGMLRLFYALKIGRVAFASNINKWYFRNKE